MRSLLSLYLITITLTLAAQNLTVMTYNIRYATTNDGEDQWDNRKAILVDQIKFYDPHVFGVQEALLLQVEYLDKALPGYNYVGVGRDDGAKKGEFSALFYKETLDTLEQGTFWLSGTPTVPSKDWDAALPRVCTYAKFSYQKNTFWVFNTHFDHIGEKARFESARLIMRQASRMNSKNDPIIIMGDLNAQENDPPIQEFTANYSDSRYSAEVFFGPDNTFNGFHPIPEDKRRIDYIFHSENIRIRRSAVLAELVNGHYPSDHFPVITYLTFDN